MKPLVGFIAKVFGYICALPGAFISLKNPIKKCMALLEQNIQKCLSWLTPDQNVHFWSFPIFFFHAGAWDLFAMN